ncbi:MAG TPA: protein-glutamate O-methyltransferase CheR [Cyclobacteriaceae bacterium]
MESTPATEKITISDEELRSLTDAINKRHGIDFSCYEPQSLKRRVIRALHIFKVNAVHELWIRILKEREFIYPFMDEISVGLTYMFRDPILWIRMRNLLTTYFKNKNELSIWHAGCSTGEEVYTMGIVLRESGFANIAKSLATDISNQAMAIAKSGAYDLLRLNEYEGNYKQFNIAGSLKKYFTQNADGGVMDLSLIQHITFEHHNLITSAFTRKFDIIFCRNVMIYFDNEAKRKLFDKFHASLNPNGLLIIGFYDAVLPLIDVNKFKVMDIDSKIFQKT